MKTKLNESWNKLTPNVRRWAAVSIVATFIVFVVSIYVNGGAMDEPSTYQQHRSPPSVGTLLSPQNFDGINQDRMVADIARLKEQNVQIHRLMKNIQREDQLKIDRLKSEQLSAASTQENKPDIEALIQDAVEAEIARRQKIADMFPPSPVKTEPSNPITKKKSVVTQQDSLTETENQMTDPNKTTLEAGMLNPFARKARLKKQPSFKGNGKRQSKTEGSTPSVPTSKARVALRTIVDDYAAQQQEIILKLNATQAPNEKPVFIPAGSIITGRLISGLDAGTGQDARKNPYPSLLRIKADAILPNYFTADLKECFVLASGYGELSSERVYIRSEKISCIRNDGGAIELPINMFAVGEDGKAGVRGRLVSKQGAILAKAMVAGFAEGVASAFGQQAVPSISTVTGGGTVPYQSKLSTQALRSGASQGATSALDRLAQHYIDMADQMFPILEVDAGRKIEFILESGVSMNLQSDVYDE